MTRRRPKRNGLLVFLTVAAGAALILLWRRASVPRAPGPEPPGGQEAPTPVGTPLVAPRPARPETVADRSVPPADFEPAGEATQGLLAVVLDDMGYVARPLERLASVEGPLALSVIPTSAYAGEAAALARKKGWDLMIHLPMAPEAGPSEQGSVGPADSDAVIAERVREALRLVPGAIGINNHQGSLATTDPRVMRAVLSVVKERSLFFLDSRTTPATVAEREARALGIPVLARDVFLDDAATEAAAAGGPSAALEQAWRRALETAARKGECVVIGHPHAATLEFLAVHLPALGDEGVTLVPVSELLN